MQQDSVSVKNVVVGDSANFAMTTGGKCDIYANASIEFPKEYKDRQMTAKLQRLFATVVLEAADSVQADQSCESYIRGVLKRYGISDSERGGDAEEDYEPVYTYLNNTHISVAYNQKDFITFCKVEKITKNGNKTMETHQYYNFDLVKMRYVQLGDLFSEEQQGEVATLVRQNLIHQLGVTSEDEVINLGYFNLDNLNLTNNFYVSDNAITWNFLPYEIACFSVGETQVSVSYDDLSKFLLSTAPVLRLR